MERGEGERLHDQRRKHFWKIVGGLMFAGGLTGFVAGMALVLGDGGGPNRHMFETIGAAILILSVILASYGSWHFFAKVDELEVADNLWGSLVGFYTYAFLFPTWWGLNWLNRAPEVNHWVVYAASVTTATAVYAYRKYRTL